MSQKHRLIRNVFSNYIAQAIYGVSNFILVGYVIRELGRESFGLIALLMSTIAITSLFETGITRALTKYVAEEIEKPGRPLLSKYVSTSFIWYIIAGVFGSLVMVALANYSERLFEIPPHLCEDARTGWCLMGLRIALVFPFTCFQGILHGYQRYDLVNGAHNIAVVLRVVVTILFFELFWASIEALLWIAIASFVVERVLWIAFTKIVSGGLHVSIHGVSKDAFYSLLGFGSLILVINVGNLLGYEAVKYVIGNKLDIADVGGYTLIATIAVYAGLLVRSISSVLTPAASRLESLGQKDNQRLLASLSTKYAMVVAGFACIVPLFLIRPLLHFWVGGKYPPEYLDMLAVAGAVLLGGEWFISTAVCVLQMFTGTAKIKVPAVVTLLWAVCGLCLAWAYIQFVEKSLMAAVVIITVARITGSVVHLIYGIWVFELRKGQLLGHSIFKPLVAAVLSCVPCLFVARFVDLFSLSGFLLVGTTLTILYAGLVWAMVLDHSEREEIVERVRHLFAGAGG